MHVSFPMRRICSWALGIGTETAAVAVQIKALKNTTDSCWLKIIFLFQGSFFFLGYRYRDVSSLLILKYIAYRRIACIMIPLSLLAALEMSRLLFLSNTPPPGGLSLTCHLFNSF